MNRCVKEVVNYASHNVNQAGAVTLTLKAGYDQLESSTNLLRMLAANMTVKVKMLEKKPFVLGTFMLKSLAFDKEGKSTIKLASIAEAVDMDRLSEIVTMELMRMMFEADIDGPEADDVEEK